MFLAFLAVAPPALTATKPNAWSISVQYPRFSSSGPAARLANRFIEARERQLFRDFSKRAQSEVPAMKRERADAQYELKVVPHRITDRTRLVSGYVDRYDYLAGAHGTSRFEAFSFGPKGRLRLRDLFRPGRDALGEASRALVSVIKSGKNVPSSVASGDWTRLTPAQADRFAVGPNGILFLFDQYDLGAGAEGTFKALVPFSKLPGLDRRGVLASVVPR